MKVSVVIPLYNKALHIERALCSVLAQTFRDFEIVVIDDGSTDNSAAVVSGIRDSRIRLIHQANAGVSVARNRGVVESRHEFVAFLDADDEWLPKFLEVGVQTHCRFPGLVASFTNFKKQSSFQPILRPSSGNARVLVDYCAFCLYNAGCGMNSSTLLASRTALMAVGGFPAGRTHGEDLDTWVRLAWSGRVAYIPDILAIYHAEDGASPAQPANMDIMPTFQSWLQNNRIPAEIHQSSYALATSYRLKTTLHLARAGRRQDARTLLQKLPIICRWSLLGIASWISVRSSPKVIRHIRGVERLSDILARMLWWKRALL